MQNVHYTSRIIPLPRQNHYFQKPNQFRLEDKSSKAHSETSVHSMKDKKNGFPFAPYGWPHLKLNAERPEQISLNVLHLLQQSHCYRRPGIRSVWNIRVSIARGEQADRIAFPQANPALVLKRMTIYETGSFLPTTHSMAYRGKIFRWINPLLSAFTWPCPHTRQGYTLDV